MSDAEWPGFLVVCDYCDEPHRLNPQTDHVCCENPHPHDQAWFWTPEWQEGEREAEADIAAGRVERFVTDDGFLASFEDPELSPELLASIRRGVAQAEAGQLRSLGDFSQYLDDEDDEDDEE